MKKIIKKQKEISKNTKITIGRGVAAMGAIGAYAFLGPNGKKNQKKAKILVSKIVNTENKIKKDWKKLKDKTQPSLKEFKMTVKKVAENIKKVSRKI